uniref:RAB6-interacting golgin n=1 Tax=Syphacia muris TaxID=451379 RepID=A0A0N5AWL5_9BILA
MQARLEQQTTPEEHSPGASVAEIFPASHEESSERRSSRAEVEARKLREECKRQRNAIASLKGTVEKLQRQMSAQESSFVAQLLAMHEKAAEGRADVRRSRARIEADLARCLESYRVFSALEAAREVNEDKVMSELINHMSVPKSITPTLSLASPDVTTASVCSQSSETDLPTSVIDERPPSVRSDSQDRNKLKYMLYIVVDRMEEGSEVADVDIETHMEGTFSSDDNPRYVNDLLKNDETGRTPPLQFVSANEDSNESSESVDVNAEQFVLPALPPGRSPAARRDC